MQTNLKKTIPGLLGALLLLTQGLYALDSRNIPVEVNLIMDGSSAMRNAGEEAVQWVSGYLVDGLLRDGDRITIWNAAGTAQIVYSETLSGDQGRENIKNVLRSLGAQGNSADFSGALREAARRNSSRSGMTYTLLISGSPASLSPALLGSGAALLRFSRVEEFPSWRALIVALNIDSQVREAAAAYLSGG
jgi:hypothetical protein